MQRSEWTFVDVGDVSVADHKPVDLKRINRLHRILPALFLNRGFIASLLAELRQIEPYSGIVYLKVRHEPAAQQSFPVNAGA